MGDIIRLDDRRRTRTSRQVYDYAEELRWLQELVQEAPKSVILRVMTICRAELRNREL